MTGGIRLEFEPVHQGHEAFSLPVRFVLTLRDALEPALLEQVNVRRERLANVGDVLRRFRQVLVPENNLGQLCLVLRSRFLVDAKPFPKVEGRPFLIREIRNAIEKELKHV